MDLMMKKLNLLMMTDMKNIHTKTFEGVINNLERRYLKLIVIGKEKKFLNISQIQNVKGVMDLGLKMRLYVKIDGLHISEVTEKSILDAAEWFKNLNKNLDKRQIKIAEHILKEINERLTFLLNVGLDYLTLSRESELYLVVKLKELD